jgi:hypothetical protein
MFAEEYLKIPELCPACPKTIQNKMSAGAGIKGVHYFSPKGMGTRFKWSAIVEWMEAGDNASTEDEESVPMARGWKDTPKNQIRAEAQAVLISTIWRMAPSTT